MFAAEHSSLGRFENLPFHVPGLVDSNQELFEIRTRPSNEMHNKPQKVNTHFECTEKEKR
eukprot:4852387-Amphidinium_carterae.1